MTDINEVADNIYRVEVTLPGLPTIFSIYLIKNNPGVLIDPGPAALLPTIQAAMAQLGITDLKYVIATHIHLDHGGAAGSLSRLYPDARVVVHPQGAKHVIDPSRLIRSTKMAFGDDFDNIYGTILPVPESQLKVAEDRESLPVDGRELVIIYSPGHAPHHIAVFDTKTKGLFCGEALGLIYDDVQVPLPAVAPPGYDAEVYLDSMARLKQLQPRILFYSHGGHGDEVDRLISDAIENTKIVGDAILKALKTEKTDEAVSRSVDEYFLSHFGIKLEEFYLAMTVGAYTVYFKKKGLV